MKDQNLEKTESQPLIYHDHKPITRRQMLAQGFIGFGAMMTLPGVMGLGIRKAVADEGCGGAGEVTLPGFMVFDMAGGAALPANFLVGGMGGPEDLLSSYDALGWDPREAEALNKDFGIPMSAKYSGVLKGILENSTAEARANVRMGSICHFAQDDTSSNQLNAGTLVLSAGYRGTYISNGMGVRRSNSGGNSRSVLQEVALKPTFVAGINDVLGATNFGGESLASLGPKYLRSLATGSVNLSRYQKELFLGLPGGSVLAELSKCAYEKSLEFVEGVAGLDPRQDASAQAAYGISAATDASDMNAVAAAVSMNAIKGFSGPGTWTLGGCDYHDGSQTTGDRKDEEMGVQMGRAIELAHRLKRPFFFQLLTDGGCDATVGTRKWRGDAGGKCMTVMGYYHPDGPPAMRDNIQIGHYTNGQGAERSTLIGSNPQLVGYAVLANYLNISGMLGKFPELAPGVFTGTGELESVLVFEGRG